jgi:hypothetical protein
MFFLVRASVIEKLSDLYAKSVADGRQGTPRPAFEQKPLVSFRDRKGWRVIVMGWTLSHPSTTRPADGLKAIKQRFGHHLLSLSFSGWTPALIKFESASSQNTRRRPKRTLSTFPALAHFRSVLG